MTLSNFLDEWLENDHKEYIKHQTYIKYRCCINNYIKTSTIADKELGDVTRKDVQDLINSLKKHISRKTKQPLSSRTINNTFIVLQSAYNYAEEFEMITKNPCVKIHRAKEEKRDNDIKCFSVSEQKKIEKYIDSLDNNEYYCYILDLYTGLRIGELCALTWDDIDFNNKTLSINKIVYSSVDEEGTWKMMEDSPKTRTSKREIPLPNHIIKQLKLMKKNSKSPYVFTMNDGSQLTPWSCRYRYDEMLKKLKVRHLNFHCMRHTFATRALERGVDITTLSEILGHSSPSITLDIYTHCMDDHKRQMMKKMTRI